ncbi:MULTISPECIES: helix-turn-helix domain-containing protein [Calothrix]|uniref:Helix-turn-helix domain-containing protein n=2 Tax=Calothrix TaxID=1186 RepID=A0ABR8AF30_9CYAN|nr:MULTISPECIES: helix-turn-helix domain-containing protein [Calothrix]MBD2198647.1 helix-turn-helix domain-containing protein [Calothrix parietina FACHB-288]MBD2227050.1 helix-turn-helix domain-containing protein [Calothrix anomala FACHB-343]
MMYYQTETGTKYSSKVDGKCLTAFQRKILQKSLQENLAESYRQRIEIMLLTDEGKSQTTICQTLGCCPATARHWMHIARTGMAHQWQDCAIGRPKAVNEEFLERLKELVGNSPRDYGYSFRRWTGNWLSQQLAKELGIKVSGHHINRLLKQMGLSIRGKAITVEEKTLEKANGAQILISDLKSSNTLDNNEFLPIHLAKLGTDSGIHGAKSIRSVSVSGTIQQYFGVLTFRDRISTMFATS